MFHLHLNSVLLFFILCTLFIVFKPSHSGANNLQIFDDGNTIEILKNDLFFEIEEPKELRYTYRARPAKDFGLSFNETFYQRRALLVPVKPPSSCGMPENAEDLEGNIALIERGDCSFLSKTVRAEEAGAVAVLIADNEYTNDDFYIEMIDDTTERTPQIPSAFLLGINGLMIRRTLKKLRMDYAVVNIPLNYTHISYHKMNQPPWVIW